MGRVLTMRSADSCLCFFTRSFLTVAALMSLVACGGSGSSTPSNQAPTITTQPAGATISKGQTANLSVTATGTSPLSYQWYQGSSGDTSTPVGTNSSSYASPPLNSSTDYWVNVSNSGGSAGSNAATITVVTPPANAVPSSYMGMQMNGGIKGISGQQPWPVVPFGAVRLWDADVSWSNIVATTPPTPDMCTSPPYDWTKLDGWLGQIPAHGADILYTFGRVPAWASSAPNDATCGSTPGSCDPPIDVNEDGSGTDQLFKNFVACLVEHSLQSAGGHIVYYELWNEMDNPPSWNGKLAQMVRMNADAIQIIQGHDPGAIILTPSVIVEGSTGRNYLQNYLAAAASFLPSIGAIAFHGYVQMSGEPLVPENINTYLSETRSILASNGLGSKPLFDTEASWGDPAVSNPNFTDPDMQAGFLARMYLLQWSENVSRFYWYQWNNKRDGILWTPDPNDPSQPGTVVPAGIAYGNVYPWLVGTVMSQGCTNSGSVWTCELTSTTPSGYQALAVWDAAQSCSNGNCTTSNFSLPSLYVQYRDLAGNTTSLSGQTQVPIGAKPILLENQTR
jgi:Ig-like domain CHU_C associated